MTRLRAALRHHMHFLVIAPLLIIIMTYPAIIHVFDTSAFWVPARDRDVWMKVWEAWHLKTALAGKSGFLHTHMMFYPEGISFAYSSYNLPHMIVFGALNSVMRASNAYCLAYLLIVFSCVSAGYFYCNYLFKDKWLALLGGVIFGCSQQVIGKSSAAALSLVAALPLTLYFLHRGIVEMRQLFFGIAGLLLGLTAYVSLYILVCDALTIALFVPFIAWSRWREWRLWRGLALFGILALITSSGTLLPMLADGDAFARAVVRGPPPGSGFELLASFINYRHPILTPFFYAVFDVTPVKLSMTSKIYVHGDVYTLYIGYTALLLLGIGLLRRSSRRRMLPWLAIAAFFLILRLGTVLRFNDVSFENILLPLHHLNQLLPMVFRGFYFAPHFQIGALLPLAVLACYGLRVALPAHPHWRSRVILLFVALVAFETYFLPLTYEVDTRSWNYINWLKAQDDQESIALMEVPMDMAKLLAPKERMLHQTMHGYPTAGGFVSRLSEAAYSYIDANPLTHAWRRDQGIVCGSARQSDILAALDQLQADGFSHVIFNHGMENAGPFLAAFADIAPAYADDFTFIYTLSQLRENCADPPPGTDSLALMLDLVYSDPIPPRDEPVITFHPTERVNEDSLRYMAWNADFGRNLNHITVGADGQFALQSTNPRMQSVADIMSQDTLLYVHDPNATSDEAWMAELTAHFKPCQRLANTAHIAIDHYLRNDMSCELVFAEEALDLLYDNGSRLRNRVVGIDGELLRMRFWWEIADGPKTSYSIQLFDSTGKRLRQIDQVMNRTMKTLAIDISDLPPGDYRVSLIVYDFESGASHGGQVAADSSRFDRAIDIARFTLDD